MLPRESIHILNFHIEKSCSEVIEQINKKIEALNKKITERQGRVAAIRKEHGIDDAALVQLLTAARRQSQQSSYSYKSLSSSPSGARMEEDRTIGAGVVNNLFTENDFIETDKSTVKKLELITRNLRPVKKFTDAGTPYTVDMVTLTYDELEFLEF